MNTKSKYIISFALLYVIMLSMYISRILDMWSSLSSDGAVGLFVIGIVFIIAMFLIIALLHEYLE